METAMKEKNQEEESILKELSTQYLCANKSRTFKDVSLKGDY